MQTIYYKKLAAARSTNTVGRLLLVMLGISALLLSSCSSVSRMNAEWKENAIDGPWVSSGVHARELTRSYYGGLMATGESADIVWVSASGKRRNLEPIFDSVDRRLKQLGYLDKWPESQSTVGRIILRVAPFTFHIISIDPTIVLMVPHDFGNPRGNRSTDDIVGFSPKQSFGSSYILNHLQYGTKIPYGQNVLWFSPDFESKPMPLIERNNSEQEIVNKHIKLLLKKENDQWVTQRE